MILTNGTSANGLIPKKRCYHRLLIAEKTYSKKYTNVNQIPKFSDATITSYCKNTSNLSAGFALSDIPRLFKQTGPRTLTIFF